MSEPMTDTMAKIIDEYTKMLPDRLRCAGGAIEREAADEIDRLRSRVSELEAELAKAERGIGLLHSHRVRLQAAIDGVLPNRAPTESFVKEVERCISDLRADNARLAERVAELAKRGEPVAWVAHNRYGGTSSFITSTKKPELDDGRWVSNVAVAGVSKALADELKPGECRHVYLGPPIDPPKPLPEPVYRGKHITVYETEDALCFAKEHDCEDCWVAYQQINDDHSTFLGKFDTREQAESAAAKRVAEGSEP